MCRGIVRPRVWLAAAVAALAPPAFASGSPVLVFRDGHTVLRNDPYLPGVSFADQLDAGPIRSIDSGPPQRLTARAARGPSVYAVLKAAVADGRITPDAYRRYRAIYKKARATRSHLKGRCGR